jgi:hypothetical protein
MILIYRSRYRREDNIKMDVKVTDVIWIKPSWQETADFFFNRHCSCMLCSDTRGFTQNFPDWLPGVRTANGTALCH